MERAPTLSPVKQAVLKQRLKQASERSVRRSEIPRRPHAGSAPLSFAQSQMWVIDQMTPGNPAYNLPYGFRLRGPLDVTALHYGFNEIIKRHETLRTAFTVEDGEPVQRIHPELSIPVQVTALDHLEPEQREGRLQILASEESVRPFDLSRLPLIRVSLFRLAPTEHVLIVNVHHIVADGLSVGLLLKELDTFYEAYTRGREVHLPELTVQYGDFAAWQRQTIVGGAPTRQIDFWRKQLSGTLPVMELPGDKPRPALQSFKGANVFFEVPADRAHDLKSLGARQGCTFFMTLLAAFQVLLQRYSGAEEMVIGTPVGVRTPADLEPLVGNFLNMVALRCDASGDPPFLELLRRSRDTALNAFSNSDLPFETMMRHLRFERDASRNPIFQVLLQVLPAASPKLGDLEISNFFFDLKFAQFDLSLHLYENAAGGYVGRFEYGTDLFEAQTVQRLCKHFVTLLEAIAREPALKISRLPLLSDAERRQLLVEWNHTAAAELRKDLCLHQLIEEQARQKPDRVAVTFEGQTLTYGELNRRANQLAHHLRRHGAAPDRLVAIFADRSIEMLVGLLGILKAGAAYVPIDPDYPKERIGCILEDSQAPIILSRKSLVESLPDFAGDIICLDCDWPGIAREFGENPVPLAKPEHLAYVLFTSGSTGRPKGVALEHRSAVTFVQWAGRVFTPQELEGVLFSTSLCFDLSVFEIFVPLSVGGRLIMARNALHLPALPEKDTVTLINTVPSAIAELLRTESVPPSVKTVNLAGEALADSLVEQIYSSTRCEKVYNLYGPTETTTYSTFTLVRRGSPVTIGRPIAGTKCYILDARRQLVPVGVPGELYIAGDGLARGYHGRPELTNERFVPDPFGEAQQARMYRTGDLCRWLPDGSIQYLGRTDHQIKLRGFRIELGEIEAGLARHPAVREVAVIPREDTPGDPRLVAYLVAEQPPADLVGQLRALVRSSMPEYMLPARFVVLEKMPRTPNGKLDRKALPAPGADDAAPRGVAVAPRTPTEQMVATAFHAVLGRDDFGVFDNFFDLGGHSLMAARLLSALRAASGAELSLRDLFARPTVAGMAGAIDALQWRQIAGTAGGRAAIREEVML